MIVIGCFGPPVVSGAAKSQPLWSSNEIVLHGKEPAVRHLHQIFPLAFDSTTLLRLSDQAKVDDRNHETISTRTEKKQYLTEDEIAGNLFILTAAGFDTTSNTMSYALVLLAAYPQWQAWIQAEIDAVLRDHDGHLAEEEYAKIFPRLTRCLAIMVSPIYIGSAIGLTNVVL